MTITGIVLAGGLGRRMGGVDKGLVKFLGQPMVSHVTQRLGPQVDEILISANCGISDYETLGYPVIKDDIAGFAGPLAGILKGMSVASHSHILTVPCDSPLLPMDLAERLMSGLIDHDADIAVAKTGTQVHPVFCLCRKSLANHLIGFLENGGRKTSDWQDTLQVTEVTFDDEFQAFANINTAADLAELEKAI